MMELRLLGGVELRMDDGADPAAILAHPKRLALLAYLAAGRPFGFHQRDVLVALLWPELDQEHARGALRQTLHRLRQSVGKRVVVARGDEAIGLDTSLLWCDVRAFDEALGGSCPEEALSLYRGDFLPGVFDAGAPEFERWIDGERQELRRRAASAAWLASDQAERAGDTGRCAEWAQRAVRLGPDDEPGARRLIVLLDRLGDRAGAGRACDQLERYLTVELDVAPSAETAALFAGIRKNDGPTGSARGASVPLRAMRPAAPEASGVVRNESILELPNAPALVNELPTVSEPQPASRRHGVSRRTKFVVLASAAVVVVAGLLTYQALHRATAPLPRIVVVPLDNRTSNSTLDPVGLMTADWIERGLLKPGLLEVVPAASVQAVMSALALRGGAAAARGPTLQNIAKETGAGLVVSGSYYTTDDRIRLELVLTDAVHDRILVSFAPVTAAVRDPTPALDTVRWRVVAAVAQAVNVDDPAGRGSPPPSLEAYELYIAARREFLRDDVDEAERILRKALAVEPNYQAARVSLAWALVVNDELAEADSLLYLTERPAAQLTASEAALVRRMRGLLDGDYLKALKADEDLAAVAPSQAKLGQIAYFYTLINRPRKALATLRRVDPRSAELNDGWSYWSCLTDALDMLGEHDRQLAEARNGRAQYPGLLATLELEALALAALGRTHEAEELATKSIDLLPQGAFTPGVVAVDVAYELRAQGDTAAARRTSTWAVHWYESRLPDEQRANRSDYARALYAAERWRESWNVRQDICRAILDPAHVVDGSQVEVDCVGWAGVLAARLHQRDIALAVDNRLANVRYRFRPQEGNAMRWRAQIAAVLGDRESATSLLRRAFAEAGVGFESQWRRHPDFLLLRDYKPYQDLMRPTG
jgi:DNA-binding SARP family transcriptional activator/tetratricopeptide (TPR) repeat protein/TolB-like protein